MLRVETCGCQYRDEGDGWLLVRPCPVHSAIEAAKHDGTLTCRTCERRGTGPVCWQVRNRDD